MLQSGPWTGGIDVVVKFNFEKKTEEFVVFIATMFAAKSAGQQLWGLVLGLHVNQNCHHKSDGLQADFRRISDTRFFFQTMSEMRLKSILVSVWWEM